MHYLILERLLQDGPSHALEALGGRSADVDDLAFVFVPRNRMANPSYYRLHKTLRDRVGPASSARHRCYRACQAKPAQVGQVNMRDNVD